jgi:hypothetical protein
MTVNALARVSWDAARNARVRAGTSVIVARNRSLRPAVLRPWRPSLVALILLTLTGWVHIIWNGGPRFVLIDDRGVATYLVIDPVLAGQFGGPRALNQKRVTITGERVSGQPETVRAISIELATEGQ